jgi:acyl-CoA thioester hydrolase
MNIDYETRRSGAWPVPVTERLDAIWETHRVLPKPAKAGRVMGLAKR